MSDLALRCRDSDDGEARSYPIYCYQEEGPQWDISSSTRRLVAKADKQLKDPMDMCLSNDVWLATYRKDVCRKSFYFLKQKGDETKFICED
jgi:hypothetical protein